MKILTGILSVLILIAIIIALIAPIGPLPGFFIRGTETPAPAVWQDTSNIHEIKLKVDGTIPRVVIIWVIDYEGELYVLGDTNSGWISRLGNGGPVEVRIEDNTYPLNAVKVTDEKDREAIWAAYLDKYRVDYPDIVASFPPLEQAKQQGSIFRLER